ncbi:hypothetical protein N7462_002626 [Penicillium macrosclerotiorum]|uniref:uncharacterized protein n=1 Tax=Penicillium macrosclerotiorum TaxID=303699 RepID=UPI002546F30D|nr:uncharacterized protein N7462_002626 [Penicillium macrosclerotiorum]KAJ5693203.1 hypothetical protein N7462_002626 [Penicillium macrosclerotiorum]
MADIGFSEEKLSKSIGSSGINVAKELNNAVKRYNDANTDAKFIVRWYPSTLRVTIVGSRQLDDQQIKWAFIESSGLGWKLTLWQRDGNGDAVLRLVPKPSMPY